MIPRIPFSRLSPAVLPICMVLSLLAGSPMSALAQSQSESGQQAELSAAPTEEAEVAVQRFLLWPLVSVEESPEWRQFSITPLYVERESADGNQKKVQVLWPLYLYRREDKDINIRILPIYTYWRDVYEFSGGKESSTQYMLFPIIFGGNSTEEGGYFAIFPIGGELKHFLGRDRITFVLFPAYLSYAKDQLHQRNYLWPVLSFTEGGGNSGFRLWPLYGYFQKEHEYRSVFVAWPIYNYEEYDLDQAQPGKRLLVFPFYAREDSSRRHYRAVLWPFFTYEQNLAGNYVERAMPWPFIIITRGDVYRTQYWPLYGHKVTDAADTTFVAWPFWHRRFYKTADGVRRESMLLPFFSSRTEFSKEEDVLSHRTRAWPLWRFRRYEDGSTYFRTLSLLWFDDEQGFERQYAPLWTLYERATAPGGYARTSAFWRLYRHVRTPNETESRIPLLLAYEKNKEQDTEDLRILGGLVGTHRKGDERSLQLLYLIHIPR